MDPDVISFFGVAAIIVGSIGCLAAIYTWTARAFRKPDRPAALPQQSMDDRIAQLQQSVDAIAVEVERIAEAQRFSTRLLAEAARVPSLTEGK